jgi:gliding motility-associated-like protein
VYGYPSFTLPAAITVLEGGSVELPAQASGNQLQYLWQGANAYSNIGYLSSTTVLNPVLTPQTDQDLLYSLAVTGQGGCVAPSSPQYIRVKVLKTPQIPNAFSPNHDGVHDNWVILYLNDYPGSTVQVFNRYGQEVFRSTGYNTAWDGKFKGQDLPIGTYYYIIDPKNGRRPISGSVTILR